MTKGIIYLKAWILYSSIFLVLDCLAFYFEFPFMAEKEIGLKEVIKVFIKIFLVGGVFSTVLVSTHLKFLSNFGLDIKETTALKLPQRRKLSIKISFAELLNLSQSFEELKPIIKIENRLIILKPALDFPFSGERISISYCQLAENNLAEIIIESRPKNKLAIIDFGRNYSNVEKIERRITYNKLKPENLIFNV